MTKTAIFAAFTVMSCAFLCAEPRPETTTYVDGNVATLKPNTGGTLVFSDNNSMVFRTGLTDVSVPYANILRAELGPTQTHSHDAPVYKVWDLPKRLHKTETQLLVLEYKNGSGENQSMTLELAKPAAADVLSTIEERTAKPEDAKTASASSDSKDSDKDAWWGDRYWKTTRNQDSWAAKQASAK
jgi:hypothetical protein